MVEEILHQNFGAFYKEYYNQVYWYIYKKINHTEDAQDLAGDVFCSCYKNFNNYNSQKSSITTWLYVIVNNRLKNYYRDRRINVPLDEQIDEQYLAVEDDMTQAVLIEYYRDMLADAIATLSEKYQLIVILKFFGEKHSDEIAKIMNMSSVNVRVTLSRALKKINEYLIKHGWNGEIKNSTVI
ncbi:MAG: sigma-70 family RNA polymerase sigma factor [Clostridia bacterium]|nr:sigma-70 family RNA polymerase sigma factor [Clostridia bacterium]